MGAAPPGAVRMCRRFWIRDSWGVIATSIEPIIHPNLGTGAVSWEDIMLVLSLINRIGIKRPLPHQVRRRGVEHPPAEAQVLHPPRPTSNTQVRN